MNRVTTWLLFICFVYHSTPTAEAGAKCSTHMDVGFLLDSSGSIRRYYNHEKKFLIALTDSLGISKDGSHAGVITFSNRAVHSIKMKDYYNMNSFSAAVNRISLMNSITRIDLGLKLAKKELFQVRNGARANTRKLLIILTDGVQSNVRGAVDPTVVANELRKMGVTVMAVGMGGGVNKAELDRITNKHAYTASTFSEVVSAKFIKKLTGETCKLSKEPSPVDGRWGPWGAYTVCSKKCGGGSKSRKRACIAPKHGGKTCVGAAVENTKCNTQPCPVNGRWGPWGAYTVCSKKCGGGSKSRKRVCIAPKYGGKPCAGAAVENTKCNTQPCPAASCPSSHPFAYFGGSYCCKYNREKYYRPQGALCDGSVIGINSKCCQSDAHKGCPAGKNKCRNYQGKPGLPSNAITYLTIRVNKRNTLLRTIPKLYRAYTVKFDFNPSVFQGGWTNILHFTTGGNCCNYGYRIPAVWFHGANSRSTKNRLHICSAVNGRGNYCFNSGVTVPRGRWTTVLITQQPEGNRYRYTVRVGNVQVGSVINTQPRVFSNVKVYASDSWYNAAQGSIRNLVIIPNTQVNLRPIPTCSTFMDVGFLLDSSGSIRRYYGDEKKFLIALAKSLGISKAGSHAGVITFSHKAVHSIKMKDYYNMNSFSKAVNKISLMNSITRIDLALKLAKKELFQVRNGARANTRKLLIILTDGVQSKVRGAVDPTIVANELRKLGVTVMAVGMGGGVNKGELAKITKGHAFTASTFKELVSDKFIRRLTGETCKVSKEQAPRATSCPSSHPFAYFGGSYCCKYNREKHYRPQGALCDGSIIGINSKCCKSDAHKRCPAGKNMCRNNQATSCPSSHPFAYFGGSYCCKYNREKHYRPQGALCDGSIIGINSKCCQSDAHKGCPAGKNMCRNYQG